MFHNLFIHPPGIEQLKFLAIMDETAKNIGMLVFMWLYIFFLC